MSDDNAPPDQLTSPAVFSRHWWIEKWWIPVGLLIVGGVITYLVAHADGGSNKPKIENVADEAAARPSLWAGPVIKYKSPRLGDVLTDEIDDYDPPSFNADGVSGDIQVYTPKRLLEQASALQGESIVVAGRFVDGSAQDSKFGVDGVVRLRGREPGIDLYVGTSSFTPDAYSVGEPLWAVVHVIASGRTMPTNGGTRRSVYVATDSTSGLQSDGDPGSRALRATLAAVQKP